MWAYTPYLTPRLRGKGYKGYFEGLLEQGKSLMKIGGAEPKLMSLLGVTQALTNYDCYLAGSM